MAVRDVIKIDEELCDGCGACVTGCPEGALQVIDGKARLVSDLFCDGLGACIGECPRGAITVERREAGEYSEEQVMENVARQGQGVIRAHLLHLRDHGQTLYLQQAISYLSRMGIENPLEKQPVAPSGCGGGCPGSMMRLLESESREETSGAWESAPSRLRQWPIQLQLINPAAPYFREAHLVVAADCVPFAFAGFHEKFLKNSALAVFCPKLDRTIDAYVDKLSEIFRTQDVKSITLVHMEVPCCFGLGRVVEMALQKSGREIPVTDYTISLRGEILA